MTSADARRAIEGPLRLGDPETYWRFLKSLGALDLRASMFLLECAGADAVWRDFCLRQADRIVVLVDGATPAPPGEPTWWCEAKLAERPAHTDVVLVHDAGAAPRGGAAYARLPGVDWVHHARTGDAADAARLARMLLDRPVGLVLGGGGAFGIAHVGVLKALEEARVPVDVVGGTSMGAIFAGGLARGWPADEIMGHVRSLFSSRFALYDPTIPFRALLAGKKLQRVLRGLFEDVDIADLWIPFFCVSTNISRAETAVHDSGFLYDAIRASCSVPGLFPPHEEIEQLLVDGGLVDNLPIDVMAERCRGAVIAVDVFPYRREKRDAGARSRGLLERLRRLSMGRLPLFDILMHATLAGSQHTTELSLSRHPPALHLALDLTDHRVLDWRAFEALYRAGYTQAKRALDAGALSRSLWEGAVRG